MGIAAVLDFSKNYFELFDLPVGYAVDVKRLAERYRDLQAASDPDRLAHVAEGGVWPGSRATIQIKDAYRTLTDPLARAKYLLALHTGADEWCNEGASDGDLLMERMELGETLAEAQGHSNPRAAVARVLTQLVERSLALDKELESRFADPTADNLEAAREILGKRILLDQCRRDAETLEAGLAGQV